MLIFIADEIILYLENKRKREIMLIQFNFKNYKSFRDDTSLDMTATKISEHQNQVVEIGGDRLLQIAAIFGANASGKSSVYCAFEFMSYYVISSFSFGGDSNKANGENSVLSTSPYMFDRLSRKDPSTFEVFFVDESDARERTYQYGFSILNNEIVEEWLYSKAKTARENYRTIFYRKKGEKLNATGLSSKVADMLLTALEPEVLIISLGSKLKISKLKRIRDWFLNNEVVDFGNPTENLLRSSMLPDRFADDKSVQQDVVKYFSSFDDSITGFRVEEVQDSDETKKNKKYRISTVHKMDNSDDVATIPLEEESSGTLKMFTLYPLFKNALDKGSLVFIDELNARLHPLLVRNIILTFSNNAINTKHAQLIFTTHDVWQFSNEILRRDELWITEKKDGKSSLYSVVDFKDEAGNKARKSEAICKNYLLGEYGGIPELQEMTVLKGNEHHAEE